MEIVFATNNPNKLKEIKRLSEGTNFTFVSLKEIGCNDELPETHETLNENSLEKAEYIYQRFSCNCIAEDTGLEVEALNGAPGVYSARYAGDSCNSADNMKLLLSNLKQKVNRKARFKTVITLILNGKIHQFEGIINGSITTDLRGKGGFGYDPVFMPENFNKTFAELTMDEKGAISHRGRALQKLLAFLRS